MIEALCYGIVAALTFIGFISLVYFAVLHIYKPKENGNYVIFVPEDASYDDIVSLIYGAYLRNIIYGDLLGKDIIIIDDGISDSKKTMIKKLASDYNSVSFINSDNIMSFLKGKENNGTGFC